MSYILDALRRAEAERERGQVPGLHAPTALRHVGLAATPRRTPWLWLALALSLSALVVLAWQLWQRATPPVVTTQPSSAATAVTQGPGQSASPTSPTGLPPLVEAQRPASPPTGTPMGVEPDPVSRTPAAVGLTAPVGSTESIAPRTPNAAPRPNPAPRAQSSQAKSGLPAGTAEADTRGELPASMRSELPKLSINGSVYSDDPASRFLIVNGEVVHEGDRLGPELSVEQIRPKEVQLRFRGYSVRLGL